MKSNKQTQSKVLSCLLFSSLLAAGSALATGCVADPVTASKSDAGDEMSDAGKTMTPSSESGSDAAAPFACMAGTKSYCSYQVGDKLAAQLQDNGSNSALSFGSVPVGKTVVKELLIEDTTGTANHLISGFNNLAAPFKVVDQGDCGAGNDGVSFKSFCVIAVSFSPTAAQNYSQDLLVNWSETNSCQYGNCSYSGAVSSSLFALVGSGTTADTLTPASYTNDFPSNLQVTSQSGLDFGTLQPGASASLDLLVNNTGSQPVLLSEITDGTFLFSEPTFSLGTQEETGCTHFTTLPAGVTCTLTVNFTAPSTPGSYVSAATVTDSVGTSVFATSVKLTATVAAPDAGADASN